jgi:methionyl-tRNA synthetase
MTASCVTTTRQPVMPESTGKLLDLLGQPDDRWTFAAAGTRLAPGTALPAPVGVFPRYQVEPSSTKS